jgi:2,4-dienoyl-CoA reductase-like NADH-dependent reductase (Old Yellow Enzyme family)
MQLSHGGRQSPNIIGGRAPFAPPFAPSAVPVSTSSKRGGELFFLLDHVFFQTPQEMSLADIDEVVHSFVRGAQVVLAADF